MPAHFLQHARELVSFGGLPDADTATKQATTMTSQTTALTAPNATDPGIPLPSLRRYVCLVDNNGTAWQQRADALWALYDSYEPEAFVLEMTRLVSERPADDAVAAHELGGAYDSTGHTDLAVPHYRRAIDLGLDAGRHRQAVIQLASSLRGLGEASESVSLLEDERDARSDELDDAVRAFLALALIDVGREREAAAIVLGALAPHLPRYQRSVTNYAQALLPE